LERWLLWRHRGSVIREGFRECDSLTSFGGSEITLLEALAPVSVKLPPDVGVDQFLLDCCYLLVEGIILEILQFEFVSLFHR
jgi:hypothetical protein